MVKVISLRKQKFDLVGKTNVTAGIKPGLEGLEGVDPALIFIVCAVFVAGSLFAASNRQTYRDAQGRNMGSASTDSSGRTTYRDSMGRNQGSATVSGNRTTVGICGGFTTFSTFSNETFEFIRSGQGLLAAAYALVSLVGGLAAVGLGWWVAR